MFKKVLMSIGLLLLAHGVLQAQGILKGTVTDAKSGEPMSFINVIAMQNGERVGAGQTDFDGVYTIKGLQVGSYDIKVTSVGYEGQLKTGVNVKASGFTIVDFKMKSSATVMTELVVEADRAPIFEVGTPESGQRITSDDIAKMPGNSVDAIVAAVGGIGYDDGGSGSARGEGGMVTMQGGVRKRTGISAPKEAIAEIQVILGGTPASIGEAIGGTQIITLKPPSSQFKGVVKYETYIDYRLLNTLMLYLTGPIYKQKKTQPDGGVTERTMIGFRLTGQGAYAKDGYYRAKKGRYKVVNDDKVAIIRDNPLSFDMVEHTINYRAEEELHADDFHTVTQKPHTSYYSVAVEGAIDFRFTDYATLTITGEYSRGMYPSTGSSYWALNMAEGSGGVEVDQSYGITVDFTQRFKDAKSQSDESTLPETKSTAAVSNVMYNITAMVSRATAINYNSNFGKSIDDVFKYGHISTFNTTMSPSFTSKLFDNHGVSQYALVQDSWIENVDMESYKNGVDPANARLARYALQVYENEEYRPYMTNRDNIRELKGLYNGDSPSSVYGMFYNTGVQNTSYGMSQTDYIYLQAKASALIKGHDLEIGFQYDRYFSSSYSLAAAGLWTLMYQNANRHISQLDYNNPIMEYEGSTLRVRYDRLNNTENQTEFDRNMRKYDKEHVGATDWLDVNSYTPEQYAAAGGMDMFSSDELFNSGNAYVSYYGYKHNGEKYNGKWDFNDFFDPASRNHEKYRYLPSFSPTYMAGYIQDRFYFQDLIFNVGVRVDYFDGGQMVLKDPYLLYESYTVADLKKMKQGSDYNGTLANNVEDDWVVYVDDAAAPTPTINGYRSTSSSGTTNWYDANGVAINSPNEIKGTSGKPTPFRTRNVANPDDPTTGSYAFSNNKVLKGAFDEYKPQVVAMPRIAFSFPVGDNSQFKASYDIIARRPSSGWQANYLGYMYMTQISTISNPNLKPEKITNYEIGFQQALGKGKNKNSAISISAYYKETRDLIQLVQYVGADPNPNYYSYDNIDFKTIKGITIAYDLRQTKNFRVNANYTLQYADGTGLSSTTMTELIKEGYTTLKMLNPIDDDRRHEFKANVDFRYGSGAKYNGPVIKRKIKDKETGELRVKEVKVLENFGINLMAVAQSGRPYTRALSNTQYTIVGSYRGARLPWGFYFDIVIDKTWTIKAGKKDTYLNLALTVHNLFDIRNVTGVFAVTGNPTDDGYLTDPGTQSIINSYLDPQSYRDLYAVYMNNNTWNYSSPRTWKVSLSYNF